jgi:hypothetical protein
VHVLRNMAGHGSLTTTRRYLYPDERFTGFRLEILSGNGRD